MVRPLQNIIYGSLLIGLNQPLIAVLKHGFEAAVLLDREMSYNAVNWQV